MRRSSKAAQEHQRAGGIQRACGIVIEKSSERRTRSLARENNSARASERHVSHASNGLGTFTEKAGSPLFGSCQLISNLTHILVEFHRKLVSPS